MSFSKSEGISYYPKTEVDTSLSEIKNQLVVEISDDEDTKRKKALIKNINNNDIEFLNDVFSEIIHSSPELNGMTHNEINEVLHGGRNGGFEKKFKGYVKGAVFEMFARKQILTEKSMTEENRKISDSLVSILKNPPETIKTIVEGKLRLGDVPSNHVFKQNRRIPDAVSVSNGITLKDGKVNIVVDSVYEATTHKLGRRKTEQIKNFQPTVERFLAALNRVSDYELTEFGYPELKGLVFDTPNNTGLSVIMPSEANINKPETFINTRAGRNVQTELQRLFDITKMGDQVVNLENSPFSDEDINSMSEVFENICKSSFDLKNN